MKKMVFISIVTCLFCSASIIGDTKELSTIPAMDIDEHYGNPLLQDEVDIIEKLIHVNQQRLTKQKNLRIAMVLFQKQKEEFIAGDQSQNHAFTMVTNARQILTDIKEERLNYLFSPEYLEELVFFSSLAAKSTPVRPETTNK